MQKYKDPKEMRMAVNGRMITMIAGIFIITTALFTTMRYGIALFQSAGEAAKGNQELAEVLEQIGVGSGYIRFTGAYLVLIAAFEVLVGVFALRLCNRLDKVKLTMKLCIALLAAEVILQPIVLRTQMMMISNLLMPLCLLWGVFQLRKLAKLYPDRKYAVEPNNQGRNRQSAPQGQKKSLRDRAMVQVKAEENKTETPVTPVIEDENKIEAPAAPVIEAENIIQDSVEPTIEESEAETENQGE